mgnify:CR=1 FL=1
MGGADLKMRRGTTPILRFRTSQDWTGYDLELTMEDDNTELVFYNDRLSLDNTDILIQLTQEETLAFNKSCKAQIRGKKDNNVIATDVVKIKVLPILNEEVM